MDADTDHPDTLIQHMRKYFKVLSELRASKQLLDFTIKVGDKNIRAHKLVLAASSDYFRAMFAYDSLELKKGEVILKDVEPSAVEEILDFCYELKIDLTDDNVGDILLAASLLQVRAVQDLGMKYAESRISSANCIGVATLSERCNLPELGSKALSFCMEQFQQVIEGREFLDLEEDFLMRLISDDTLNVDNEEVVLQAVINWVEADPEERSDKIETLLSKVRLALIEPIPLVKLASTALIQKYPACRDMIDKAKNFIRLKNCPEYSALRAQCIGSLNTKPRNSLKQHQRLYAVGGWDDNFKKIASAAVYNPNTDSWSEISPMTHKKSGLKLTALNDSIYAVGGRDDRGITTVERYDVNAKQWFQDVAYMKNARYHMGVVTLNGYIYAIGGLVRSGATDRVERYDPIENTWTDCAPLNTPRYGVGVAVYKHYIYVMGGRDKNSVFDSVERYDSRTNTWTFVKSMNVPRAYLGSCVCRGKIFAAGGRNDSGELGSAEVYDLETSEWAPIQSMHEKRWSLGLVELADQVYAIGGRNECKPLNDVEAYDIDADKWVRRKPMRQVRLCGGMAVHPMRKT